MRALVAILDSVGVGAAPDASQYGDEGANTIGHILDQIPGLRLPAMDSMGLREVISGDLEIAPATARIGCYGRMREQSAGKDTTTGHWEIAGVILETPFAVFEKFPDELVTAIETEAGVQFIGNYARSGTTILEELGEEHVRTGKPILYTSADSVMQIASHEEIIPLPRLYEICSVARRHCDKLRIGRVIARPFTGEAGKFLRTTRRHDYSMVPPRTVLNAIAEAGIVIEGIGKIGDIFAGSGITRSHPTKSNAEGMAIIRKLWQSTHDGLLFANLVDFDMLYGHRRDVTGYAKVLVEFDQWLGEFLDQCESDDLLIVTADHGNDPTFRGTDHTREEVPLLVKYDAMSKPLGVRLTFADVAATLAAYFQLEAKWTVGEPFLQFDHSHAHPFDHRA
jgi:phosphopentomutase